MNRNYIFVDPFSKEELSLKENFNKKSIIETGLLVNSIGNEYKIKEGIPDFRYSLEKFEWLDYYEKNAETYDDYNYLTYRLQGFDESEIRSKVISKLNIKKNEKILEVGCGTGRDSIIINDFLKDTGELYLVDLSGAMLKKCKNKLRNRSAFTEFVLSDGNHLPFPDKYFDKVFSFVTLPAVENKELFLKELTRVTKIGGKVLVGSEGIMPSLKKTLFGKLLINNCNLYENELPLNFLPTNIKELKIEWILNGIIFLLDFEVTETEPIMKNLPILGKRGGTFYTRYFGKLEGITVETKEMALKAMQKSELSQYEWLNRVIIKAAMEDKSND